MVPRWCVTKGLRIASPIAQTFGDLANTAFYYLLPADEYTYIKATAQRRTQQFRVCDVKF